MGASLAAEPGSPAGIALCGVPLPEPEEAIFTECLKETEKESGAYSILYRLQQ